MALLAAEEVEDTADHPVTVLGAAVHPVVDMPRGISVAVVQEDREVVAILVEGAVVVQVDMVVVGEVMGIEIPSARDTERQSSTLDPRAACPMRQDAMTDEQGAKVKYVHKPDEKCMCEVSIETETIGGYGRPSHPNVSAVCRHQRRRPCLPCSRWVW